MDGAPGASLSPAPQEFIEAKDGVDTLIPVKQSGEWDYQHAERRADVALQPWMIENGIPLWPAHDLSVVSLEEWREQHGEVLADEATLNPLDILLAQEATREELIESRDTTWAEFLAELEARWDKARRRRELALRMAQVELLKRLKARLCAAPDCDNALTIFTHPRHPKFCSKQCRDRVAQRARRARLAHTQQTSHVSGKQGQPPK